MIKVYFDNTLIETDSYTALTNDYNLFTDTFYLGSTACNTFKLSVLKSVVNNQPENVRIEDDANTYFLVVDKITEDKDLYIYDLVDKLMLFNFNYDASVLINDKQTLGEDTYLIDILRDMCDQANIVLDNGLTLINNIKVTWYDNTLLARDYLGYIAELQGGFAKINNNGELTLVEHNTLSKHTFDIGDIEELIINEEKTITKVVYDNGIVKWEAGNDTGDTLYLDTNNVYIINQETVTNIFNKINGFDFYVGEITKCNLPNNLRAGDIITVNDNGMPYKMILAYSKDYAGGNWSTTISNNIKSTTQTETDVIGNDDKLKSLKTKIDRDKNELLIEIQEVDDSVEQRADARISATGWGVEVAKIAPLQTQTANLRIEVDELRNEIGDVTDITTTEEGFGTLQFESINTSEPINILIKPTVEKDISYIYPSSKIYPSSTLYPQNRILRFTNTTTNEEFDYPLPSDLRYLDANTYDELYLDYSSLICKITRRVEMDANLVKSAKATPDEEFYDYPSIPLSAGNYTITLLGYPNAYLKIRLMSQNMYTSQFATRVEVSSAITQTANEINSTVSLKVGKDEVISRINQTAEAVKIEASKINISGVLTAINNDTTTTINGNKITTGSITANQVSADIITTSNFSAQNISANQITSGTISTDRLSSNVITTGNLNAQSISASQITTGTMSANRIDGGTINATNINVTNLTASNITRGSISGIPYSYTSSSNGSVQLGDSSNGPIMGYRGSLKSWSIAAFTTGGRFQTFNSSGNMAAYLNQTGVHTSSDIRDKRNIKEIDEKKSLNIIKGLTPITYDYNDNKYHRGLSAQQVEKVLKESGYKEQVYSIEENKYTLNYAELIPDLINCIKYQQKQLDKASKKIKMLETNINE